MDGFTAIIVLCGIAILMLVVYLVYRISTFRSRARPVEGLSRDIASMKENRVSSGVLDMPIIPDGRLLVVMTRKDGNSWKKAVREGLSRGRKGIIITHRAPSLLRSSYRGNVQFVWLDRSTARDTSEDTVLVNPTNLSRVLQVISSSMERESLIVIEELDVILSNNDHSRVIRFMKMLNEKCEGKMSSGIVPVPYRAVPQRTRVQITDSFETVVV